MEGKLPERRQRAALLTGLKETSIKQVYTEIERFIARHILCNTYVESC